MKRILLALLLVLFLASSVLAAPFLVCDPQAGVDYYVVTGLPASMTGAGHIIPDASGTYGFRFDLATLPVGSYTVRAKACTLWGCSVDTSPLDFARPASVNLPLNLRLTP